MPWAEREKDCMKSRSRIVKALEHLLERNSLDEISVTQITTEAGVARKTFYRNFRDKYDLMNWYYDNFYHETFGSIIVGNDFREALLNCLELYEEKRVLLRNAYASRDINGLKNHDVEITKNIYNRFLQQKGADTGKRALQFAVEIAVRGGTEMIILWVRGDLPMEKEELCSLLIEILPAEIYRYIK